jgi:RecB family exonuclease
MEEKKIKRDYKNKYPSVTTVIGILRKPALEYWFKIHTAEECDLISKKAKEIGDDVHALIEKFVKGEKATIQTTHAAEVKNAIESFKLFRKENPEFQLDWAELQISDDTLQLNGTIDCVGGDANDDLVILDWKTGECKEKEKPQIYFEYLLQVAAYVKLYEKHREREAADIVPTLRYQTIYDKHVRSAYVLVLAKDKIAYALRGIEFEYLDSLWELFNHLLAFVKGRKVAEKFI